jgi:hypothetical protein
MTSVQLRSPSASSRVHRDQGRDQHPRTERHHTSRKRIPWARDSRPFNAPVAVSEIGSSRWTRCRSGCRRCRWPNPSPGGSRCGPWPALFRRSSTRDVWRPFDAARPRLQLGPARQGLWGSASAIGGGRVVTARSSVRATSNQARFRDGAGGSDLGQVKVFLTDGRASRQP